MTRTRFGTWKTQRHRRIYTSALEDGIATFQSEPRSVADIGTCSTQRGDTFPTVVVERDGDRGLGLALAYTAHQRGTRRSSSTPCTSSERTAELASAASHCWC